MLKDYDTSRYELNEGDYREDSRVYDHVHSTGMICHVGPEGKDSGLTNYVREIRKRIKNGGRYLHHCMMIPQQNKPLFRNVGAAFNRKYVWPGFYYYSLGDHMKALGDNGFHVIGVFDIAPHCAKTTLAWYERMVQGKEIFVKHTNEATYRAWQIYLTGALGGFLSGKLDCYRLLCEARDLRSPSIKASNPLRNIAARRQIAI